MSQEEWFDPKTHTGWQKSDPAVKRRRKLLKSADKRKNLHGQFLEAARRIQALANVTKDQETKTKAKEDAKYFFTLAKKVKGLHKKQSKRR